MTFCALRVIRPFSCCLNRIEPGARKQFEDARGLIERTFGLQVCPFFISQFRAYENALETGQTAQELDPRAELPPNLKRCICSFVNM